MDGETNGSMKYPDYEGWVDENMQRFIDADLMADDGPEHQRNSSFQIRRRAQVKLLREMWANFWPDYPPLTTIEARRLLRACSNSAEDVLHFTSHAASYQYREKKRADGSREQIEIDTPAAYVLKVIKAELQGMPDTAASDEEVA